VTLGEASQGIRQQFGEELRAIKQHREEMESEAAKARAALGEISGAIGEMSRMLVQHVR
jgi:hypothetical protein